VGFLGKFSNLANFLIEIFLDKSVFLVQFLSKLAFLFSFFFFGKISQIFYLKKLVEKESS
jgi:hypothetical protein